MAYKIKDIYPSQVDTNDVGFPDGKPRNIQGGIQGTGTPFEEKLFQDYEGARQALFAEAGVEPSGVVDRVGQSDFVEATKLLEKSANKVITSDGRNVEERLDAIPNEVDAAGTAEALVGVHNSDPAAHPELSAFITSEADRAEAAADAATISGNVYENSTAGVAATSEGEYFSVVSNSTENYLDLYKNVSNSAVFQKSYPSIEMLPAIRNQASIFSDNLEIIQKRLEVFLINTLKAVYIEKYNGEKVKVNLLHEVNGKCRLNLKISSDDGATWSDLIYLDFSYIEGVFDVKYESPEYGTCIVLINGSYLQSSTGINSPSSIINAEIKTIESLLWRDDVQLNTDKILDIQNSVFNQDMLVQNATITKALHRGIRRVTFTENMDDRKIELHLLSKGSTKIILNLKDVTDPVNPVDICYNTSVEALESGWFEYTYMVPNNKETYGKFVKIEINSNVFEEFGYQTSGPVVNSEIKEIHASGLTTKRDFSVFTPNAYLEYGGADYTSRFKEAIKAVIVSGNNEGLSLFIHSANWEPSTNKVSLVVSAEEINIYQNIAINAQDFIFTGSPSEYHSFVMNKDNNKISSPVRDLEIEFLIRPDLLPNTEKGEALLYSATANYETRGLLNTRESNDYSTANHNSITQMLDSGGLYPYQNAGALPLRMYNQERSDSAPYITDFKNFTPMWNGFKSKKQPKHELIKLTPPTVAGHFNSHSNLGDIDDDGRWWIYGMGDKLGRVYYSDDEGETLVEHSDIYGVTQGMEIRTVWCLRVLPNDELFMFYTGVTVQHPNGLDERRTLAVYTSGNRTVWNQCLFDGTNDPFHMDHYQEGSGDNITFEDPSRVIDSWGFDTYHNYALAIGYGAGTGTGTPPHDSVGHGHLGGLYLSKDYGATWEQIFDFFNMPASCTPLIDPDGGHHSHGCFFDHYHMTDDIPRIVGIYGDQENRLVISDDLGSTWFDNASGSGVRNNYQQAVCGMATSWGWITGTDAVNHQGIQLTHRGDKVFYTDEIVRTISESDESLASSGLIVHVGIGFTQRKGEFPIITGFTPESIGRFSAGTRGQLLASWDGGVTWTNIYDERDTSFQFLDQITGARILQDPKGQVFLVGGGTSMYNVDGSGLRGWVVKIIY